jgi:DNA-directed RNA polymerase subunit M/transcription elongation factor TFIIS
MSLFSAYVLPLQRQMHVTRIWPSIRAYLYSTKTPPEPPRQLKTDSITVKTREQNRRLVEYHKVYDRKYRKDNLEKRREDYRVWYQAHSDYQRFRGYLFRHPGWAQKELTWKTHRLIATEERVKRACASCGHHEFAGLKMWWARKNENPDADSVEYDCTYCFYAIDPERSKPVGYEDLAFGDMLLALHKARREHDKTLKAKPSPSSSEDEKSR